MIFSLGILWTQFIRETINSTLLPSFYGFLIWSYRCDVSIESLVLCVVVCFGYIYSGIVLWSYLMEFLFFCSFLFIKFIVMKNMKYFVVNENVYVPCNLQLLPVQLDICPRVQRSWKLSIISWKLQKWQPQCTNSAKKWPR